MQCAHESVASVRTDSSFKPKPLRDSIQALANGCLWSIADVLGRAGAVGRC